MMICIKDLNSETMGDKENKTRNLKAIKGSFCQKHGHSMKPELVQKWFG